MIPVKSELMAQISWEQKVNIINIHIHEMRHDRTHTALETAPPSATQPALHHQIKGGKGIRENRVTLAYLQSNSRGEE